MTKVEKELKVILNNAKTARERIIELIAFNPKSRPGTYNIREKQLKIIEKLADIYEHPVNLNGSSPSYCWKMENLSPKPKLTTQEKWNRRAEQSGDKTKAINLANSYHQRIKPLYKSKFASVAYGEYAKTIHDSNCYSKKYHAKYGSHSYKCAAVSVEYHNNKPVAVLKNYLNNTVAEIPIVQNASYDSNALTFGDLYGIEKHGIVVRYDQNNNKIGVAVPVNDHWEHGASIKECKNEVKHKMLLIKVNEIKLQGKYSRITSLALKLCGNLEINRQDARDAGNCNVGINGFLKQCGWENKHTVTLKNLKNTNIPQSKLLDIVAYAVCRVMQLRRKTKYMKTDNLRTPLYQECKDL